MENIYKVHHIKSGERVRLDTTELLGEYPSNLNEYILGLESISKVSIVDSASGTVLIRKEA